ncbi:MAG: NAD(P)-dependent oxidoreductase [Tannerella sp.]|jgi:nucleoside-diphosphate-sugar epimerase|nr:NAD(P)-dependent oxidoreductase [Tannerella sp.]
MNERKRILITGASGFIGGFLVKEALRRGYDVWAGIRPNSSREHLQDERIHFINVRYDDKSALTKQLLEVVATSGAWHYIIHNAGITKAFNTADFYKVNALYTHKLIESLNEADCRPEKFLLMSSLSSYGPVNEYSFRPIRIDDEQQPDSVYGKSKLQAELFVKAQTYFPYIILRPTGVYGPGDKDYLMEIKSIKSGFDLKVGMKPQNITFIYVKDLAVAVFLALENSSVCDSSYFVADGDVYTDHEFAGIIKKILSKRFVFNLRIPLWICYMACVCSEIIGNMIGKPMTLNTDKYKILRQRNWICETDPTRRELGFIPQYDLKEGLEETVRYSREHGLL